MEISRLVVYVANLNREIKKCYMEAFLKYLKQEANNEVSHSWIVECESVLQNFVLSRYGWEESERSDMTEFIFRGKHPLRINLVYESGGAGLFMIHTATGIAKAELLDDLAKGKDSLLEVIIDEIVACVESQNWIIEFPRHKIA